MIFLDTLVKEFMPEDFSLINWRDIWSRPLEEGTAFQWAVISALRKSLINQGWSCESTILSYMNGGDLTTLRNEIPLSHLAKAGHSAVDREDVSLNDKFLQSLIPKFTFTKNNKNISLFIEGCPYHKIATGKQYEIRPDILLLPGKLEGIEVEEQFIKYKYRYSEDLLLEGVVRVGSSRLLPVVKRLPAKDIPLDVTGVIECSVNKTGRVALAQIEEYRAIFDITDEEKTVLITGNEIKLDCGPMTHVDLSETDFEVLKSSFDQAGNYICSHLTPSLDQK